MMISITLAILLATVMRKLNSKDLPSFILQTIVRTRKSKTQNHLKDEERFIYYLKESSTRSRILKFISSYKSSKIQLYGLGNIFAITESELVWVILVL